MIRIALVGQIPQSDEDDLASLLASYAKAVDPEGAQVDTFATATQLVDACAGISDDEQPYDLAVIHQGLPAITGLQLIGELHDMGLTSCGLGLVLCAADTTRVADAARMGVDGFLVEPVGRAALEQAVKPLLAALVRLHMNSCVLRCREGVRRLPFAHVRYIETTGRDQAIHRKGAPDLTVRCSSKTLFASLGHDPRFFKLGSSYILNLDYVDELNLRSGMVTLLDGTQVPAPVRLRTDLADAICRHAAAAV